MDLYIVRHAEAVPRGAPGMPDEKRPLTPEGQKDFRQTARWLKNSGVRFDRLYFSPWLRAAATAEMLMPLVIEEAVSTVELTRSPRQALLEAFQGETVGVVGHEPYLSELLAWLLFDDRSAASRFDLKKGGVAHLHGTPRPGGMVLRGFYALPLA